MFFILFVKSVNFSLITERDCVTLFIQKCLHLQQTHLLKINYVFVLEKFIFLKMENKHFNSI